MHQRSWLATALPALLLLFVVDNVLTLIGLKRSLREANPLMAAVLDDAGVIGFFAFKLAILVIVYWLCHRFYAAGGYYRRVIRGMLGLSVALYLVLNAANLWALLAP